MANEPKVGPVEARIIAEIEATEDSLAVWEGIKREIMRKGLVAAERIGR